MGATGAYLTAVVAGAVTAGIGAANVLAVPPDTAVAAESTKDVGLSAVTIPVIDIGPTPGPLSIWRYLAIQAGTNPLLLGLVQQAGNTYDLPGLFTTVDSDTNWFVKAVRNPGESIDFGATADQSQSGAWKLLGGALAGGSSAITDHRDVHFVPLTGGSGGLGFGLNGVLGDTQYDRNLSLLDSNLDIAGDRTLAEFDGVTALQPFDGFKAVGGGTLFDAEPDATFNLGSLTGGAGGHGGINGDGGLCLGSSRGDEDCGGNISFVQIAAPVSGALTLGNTQIASADFEDNALAVKLKPGQFSVTGAVGGSFTVGGVTIGRPIPIDFQIPRASSMLSSTNSRQTVKTSLVAVPGKAGADSGTASTGRHAAGDAVNSAISGVGTAVKTAVSTVANSKPKHAKPDTED
ncbi:MAG TPA: hypothetical protein VJR50_13990 [Mycobacterium sp.]|nr:hypothetical protein [Mycobacterium sp.]